MKEEYTREQTCGACPEIWEFHLNGELVGNLRLRYSYATITAHNEWEPSVELKGITSKGDGLFDSWEERDIALALAEKRIRKYRKRKKEKDDKVSTV